MEEISPVNYDSDLESELQLLLGITDDEWTFETESEEFGDTFLSQLSTVEGSAFNFSLNLSISI